MPLQEVGLLHYSDLQLQREDQAEKPGDRHPARDEQGEPECGPRSANGLAPGEREPAGVTPLILRQSHWVASRRWSGRLVVGRQALAFGAFLLPRIV